MDFDEVCEAVLDVIQKIGPLRMPRELNLFVSRKVLHKSSTRSEVSLHGLGILAQYSVRRSFGFNSKAPYDAFPPLK